MDTTWPMAINTKQSKGEHHIEITSPPETNILWRWMGLRMVPHLPCSFECKKTKEFGKKLFDLGVKLGFEEEMNWLKDILSWSVEWTALHGIAEIKTPLLKISTKTDATAQKYTVRLNGIANPKESSKGIMFPNVTFIKSRPEEWYYRDNGFSSRFVMDTAHQPLLDLIKSFIERKPCNVVDLGCGNGALLKKIIEDNHGITPFGIDYDPINIEHSRILIPRFRDNFFVGNIFGSNLLWTQEKHYDYAILMPGRLLEVEEETRIWLKKKINDQCDNLIIYAYGDWLSKYDGLDGLAHKAGIELISPYGDHKASLAKFV